MILEFKLKIQECRFHKNKQIATMRKISSCVSSEKIRNKNNLNKTSPNFTILDEMFLNMYCEHVALSIEKL